MSAANLSAVDDLQQVLLTIPRNDETKRIQRTRHGAEYVVEGLLQTPGEEIVKVRTV